MEKHLPRYPIYVISKGRSDRCLTANFLVEDGVPFKLVVEPQEREKYAARYGNRVEVLPFSNLGRGSIPARNWVWNHSVESGSKRHWILDDNILRVRRFYKGKRLPCEAGPTFSCVEDFTDRYENIAITGLNYQMFGVPGMPPFYLNVHVYSCLLISNDLPYRWRGRYNEDTDLCLQVLSGGLCTVLVNAFLIEKMATMTMKGGNMDSLYKGDGRLRMARSLERVWPRVVKVDRRFKRPQHVVRDNWGKFDTPLKRKPEFERISGETNEYGLSLERVSENVKSPEIREMLSKFSAGKSLAGSGVV